MVRWSAALLVAAGIWAGAAFGQPVKAVTVASGLDRPWSLGFLPDGRMLVTEKAGRLRVISGSTVSAPLGGVPEVDAAGQGGLFDVLVAPDFASSRRIWLSYAEPGKGSESGRNGLAVGTAVLNAAHTALEEWQVVFRHSPKVSSRGHFGGRLVWQGNGHLFVTLGDRQSHSERGKAQDLALGHGKVMRIVAASGSAAAGNPFVAPNPGKGAQPAIWSYGHRNVQGAALHPGTGELWVAEHGPQGGDELNRVLPGRNYGWPLVSHGCEYGSSVDDCKPVGGASVGEGFEPPLAVWLPTSVAPSGLAFYSGNRFPEWHGQLFMGALTGRALWRIELRGNVVVSREPLLGNLNERVRDVRQGPDGELYIVTDSSNGRVLRLER